MIHILVNARVNTYHYILLVHREYLVFFALWFIAFVLEKRDIFHSQVRESSQYIEIIVLSGAVLRMQGLILILGEWQSFFLYFPDGFPSSLVLIFL